MSELSVDRIYREQLSSLFHGVALWDPKPVEKLHHRPGHVSIGDVGYLYDGAFMRMFNVTLPWDDSSNELIGKPEKYELIEPSDLAKDNKVRGGEYYTPNVSKGDNVHADTHDDSTGQMYQCRAQHRGALLSIPHGGTRKEVIRTKLFKDYIKDNVDDWFRWSRKMDLPVEHMEDLILVTGCTLVTSWAAAAFCGRSPTDSDATTISLEARKFNGGRAQFIWRNDHGDVEYDNSSFDPNVQKSLPQDQCAFIKGFRAKRTLFWTIPMQAAAEPLPDDPDNRREGEIQVTRIPNGSKYRDPLVGILDYIIQKCNEDTSAADSEDIIAIVHDDDLRLIEGVGTLTADAIEKFLHEKQMPLIVEDSSAILGNHKPPVSSTSAPPTSVFSTSGKVIRIDVLPDDVLLEIFDLCVDMNSGYDDKSDKTVIEGWQPLAHVCRRWRNIVLLSPHRLDLKLYCSPDTPAKDTLYIWPPLPLIIAGTLASSSHTNNVIAALGRNDCVIQVFLVLAGSQLEKVLAPMQVSFPGLTDLRLFSYDETPYTLPVIPDSFLGGSAPRLRTLELGSIPFPGLPILLLSATHLVSLSLYGIPHSGYISPQAIAAVLPVLSNLELLHLEFQSPQSRPDWESPSLPLSKRSILPVLTEFHFKGVTEYLEELMTYIDTPQLKQMNLHFFNQIDFDCPRLAQFINCTPTLKALDEAHVQFDDSTASVNLGSRTSKSRFDVLLIHISCREPDWQLSSIEQVCNWLLPLSTVVVLHIDHQHSKLVWKDDAIDDTLWLQLLLPFTAVEDLYLSNEFAPGIAAALQELVGNRITGVLPSLQNIFVKGLGLSGSFEEKIGQVVAARQFSEHPIAVSDWDEDSRLRLM